MTVAAMLNPAFATFLYGAASNVGSAIPPGMTSTVIAALGVGGLLAIGFFWLVSRWLIGRMVLLLLVGGGVFLSALFVIDLHVDIGTLPPAFDISTLAASITAVALAVSIARPQGI